MRKLLMGIVLVLAGCAQPAKQDEYRFVASYQESSNPGKQFLVEHKLLEMFADEATALVKAPENIPVIGKECGEANAFWSPDEKTVTMCYELVADYQRLFTEAKAPNVPLEVTGATTSVFFHELGHGLISLFDLPVTGKEEDAVDQLSALLLSSGGDEGQDMLISAASAWRLLADEETEIGEYHYADEHSLSAQRYYNMLCYLYGSDVDKFDYVVKEGYLPEGRADRCPAEYDQINKAWSTLLGPHLKD